MTNEEKTGYLGYLKAETDREKVGSQVSCRRRMPPIIIKTRKFLQGRREMREVLEIQALEPCQLPEEYLQKGPHVFLACEAGQPVLRVMGGVFVSDDLYLGDFSEKDFQRKLRIVQEAGERLAKIPFHPWEGEETIEI